MRATGPIATCFLALTLLVSTSASALTAQGGSALVAPLYPGTLAIERLADREFPSDVRAFLSKDPLEAVKAFYDRELGGMENLSLSDLDVPEELRSEMSRKDTPFVFAKGLGRGDHGGVYGVEISALTPQEERAPTRYAAVGPVFEKLMMGQVAGEATQAEFDQVIERYKHLAWRFYPITDRTSDRGRPLTADQVAFRSCESGAGGGLTTDEIMAKIQEAYATGDLATVQRLTAQMTGATGMSGWDTWVDCLEKIEAEAYTTLITIHLRR